MTRSPSASLRDEENLPLLRNHDNNDDDEYTVQERLGDVSFTVLILCMMTAGFLASIDTSIIMTIFNVVGTEFHSSNLAVWIMTSYMLATSTVQPIYGKLSDVFGRKTMLVTSIWLFLIGSWLCGFASSMLQMGIARAIAGLGCGGIWVLTAIIIHDLVPIRKRGQYQSYMNMSQTVGTTIGAPLGGLINDYFGWRYCFYVNIPFCIFVLYVYMYKLDNYNLEKDTRVTDNIHEKLGKIDFIGAGLLLAGNFSFVTGVSFGGNTYEWSDSLIVSLLAFSVVFFITFVVYEFNWANHPLLSRKLLMNRNAMAVCLNNFFLCQSTMTLNYIIPQYFMGVLKYSPSSAGVWVLPRAAMVATGCYLAGCYLKIKGTYKHFLVTVMSFHVVACIATRSWNLSTPLWFNMLCMNLEGFIFGTVVVSTMVALVADISHSETASATSMMSMCRSSGWLLGSAISSAIMQSTFKSLLYEEIEGDQAVEIIEFVRTSITKIHTLSPEIQKVIVNSLLIAIKKTMVFGICTSLICFLCTLLLKNCKLHQTK